MTLRAAAIASGATCDAIGSHIGDKPDRFAADVDAFIKPLGDVHRAGWRKAELA